MRVPVAFVGIAMAACAMASAEVENVIIQHNPQLIELVHYVIYDESQVIVILQGSATETFEFEAVALENGEYQNAGNIRQIFAVQGVGPVTITVLGHNGHEYGAEEIGEIDLSEAMPGHIAGLTVNQNLGQVDGTPADPSSVGAISGPFTITREISQPLTIDAISGDFYVNILPADIDITGNVSTGATLTAEAPAASSTISVGGSMLGTMWLGRPG